MRKKQNNENTYILKTKIATQVSVKIFKMFFSDSSNEHIKIGTSDGIVVSKLYLQTFTNEFEPQWVPHSYSFVPHQRKRKLNKLQTHTHAVIKKIFDKK